MKFPWLLQNRPKSPIPACMISSYVCGDIRVGCNFCFIAEQALFHVSNHERSYHWSLHRFLSNSIGDVESTFNSSYTIVLSDVLSRNVILFKYNLTGNARVFAQYFSGYLLNVKCYCKMSNEVQNSNSFH